MTNYGSGSLAGEKLITLLDQPFCMTSKTTAMSVRSIHRSHQGIDSHQPAMLR